MFEINKLNLWSLLQVPTSKVLFDKFVVGLTVKKCGFRSQLVSGSISTDHAKMLALHVEKKNDFNIMIGTLVLSFYQIEQHQMHAFRTNAIP